MRQPRGRIGLLDRQEASQPRSAGGGMRLTGSRETNSFGY